VESLESYRPHDTPIERLRAIMARLRDPATGCEWDTAQTFASIAPYTIEEAYEVADACERADMADLKDELGDLLLQVIFHARMAEEAGAFDFDAVAAAISDKMERRHPHIFGDRVHGGHHLWEEVKADERAAKGHASALDGVALSLPALTRAEKIQKRAARVGFDWPDASGPRAKIHEELAEADSATSDDERAAEIGDLLFAVTNYARHHQVDPEQALRTATARFEQRFRLVEEMGAGPLSTMTIDQLEALWQRAKAQLSAA
jgi:ATP diphosphatase